MGIKGCKSRPTVRRVQQKTHETRFLPFCPGAAAEGMAGSESSNVGSWPGNGGERFMDLRCELCKNKCCIYLPEVSQTERKGRKDRRESARRTGLRNLGLVQKTGRINVHLVVHTDGKSVRLQERKSTYCSVI